MVVGVIESLGIASTSTIPTPSNKESMDMASKISDYSDESKLELGLGLSLGFGNGNRVKGGKSVQYARILTAKDLPSHMSAAVSSSPSSSSSSSSPPSSSLTKANLSAGTKRNADSLATTANLSQAVGWPPVGAYRKNNLVNQVKSPSPGEFNSVNDKSETNNTDAVEKTIHGSKKNNGNGTDNESIRISTFVKVNMDGTLIGRKVDLKAHSCYESLAYTLEEMFCKPSSIDANGEEHNNIVEARRSSKLLDGSSEFVLTYEDKDGDLMLVGDVPWRMFLGSVKRLRIMRASDANGLAPRFQE